jgi:hypothetical protein
MQSNNQQQTHAPVSVYFKEAFTTNTKNYIVYPDWTLNQFEAALRPLIAIDFDIELDDFFLVLVGQPDCEDGVPMLMSDDLLLLDLGTPELNIAFYIRRR